jgi:predicted nuclease of restriction endonuclease-like (RecB) superfamily
MIQEWVCFSKFKSAESMMKTNKKEIVDPRSYDMFLEHIKKDIQDSQLRAAVSINKELIELYWRIGKMLSEKALSESWGSKTIERIAKDLASSFPNVNAFSHRNLKFMRQFADSYSEGIRETAISLIPWGHNILLMQRIPEKKKRLWYAQQVVENGWSWSSRL